MELKVIAAEHILATGNKDGRWTNVYVTPLADAQATIAALQDTIMQMGEQAAVLAKDGMATKAQVAALQRELLEWKRALCNLTPGGSEFADDHAYCAEWVRKARENQHDIIISKHRKLKATQTALDAEREKAKNDAMAYRKLSEQWNATDLELSQLKALVRALCNSGDRLLDDVIGTSDAADSLKHHIRQVRATLDATTPAECTNHFTDGSKIFPSRNCCSKGGDGE